MNIVFKKKALNEVIISAFVIICIFFPNDIFDMKKILFLLICILNFKHIVENLFYKRYSWLLFFGILFPTALFMHSTILTGNILDSFSRSFSAYIILIVIVINYYNINFEKILLNSIKTIMIITILLALLDILNVVDVNSGVFREVVYANEMGFMGKAWAYPFYYKIFFKTSPLLVVLLFKSFNDSNYILTAMTMLSLILSGTRANVIFPILFLILFYIFYWKDQSLVLKSNVIIIFAVILLLMTPNIMVFLREAFIIKGAASDIVREGHLRSIIELVQESPSLIITGSGMGSYFYSYGRNEEINSMEWSYIDLWRQMGLFFFVLFIIFICIPLFNNEISKYKKMAYITYLFIAATNPLLFSSTSYLLYIYMYYKSDNKTESVNQILY